MHRSRFILSRALVATLLALGATAAAAPALAATPQPAPSPSHTPRDPASYVEYTGNVHAVFYDENGTPSNPSDQTITLAVDCSTHPCTLQNFYQSGEVQVIDGHGSASFPASGTPCGSSRFVGAETVTVDATATTMSAQMHEGSSGEVACPGGGTTYQFAGDFTFTGTRSSGDACALTGSCPTPTPAGAGHRGGAAPGSRHPSTPSVLSALPTVATALTARNALWAAAAAVVLVILIALPTQLFNSASERAGERISSWWRRIRPQKVDGSEPEAAAAGTTEPTAPVAWSGWPLAAAGVLGASIISAFVDPNLTFDVAGLRTVLSILVSFILDVVIGWFVLLLVVRRTHPGVIASFEFKPVTIVVVAVAVLLSRITGFQPGIVFGLVAGIVFGGLIGTAKARVALIGLGYAFAVGILAWIGYSIIAAAAPHPNAVLVFVQETLSSTAIAGIAALPIALLPLGALIGREVWQWSRIVWAVAYAIGLAGFFLVLMPMPFAWESVPLSLWTWIGLYLLYALGAVGVWVVVTQPWKKDAENAEATKRPTVAT